MRDIFQLVVISIFLSGCMDTAIRLWNSGPYISSKERELFRQCRNETTSTMPQKPENYEESQAWLLELSKRTSRCVQNRENQNH